MPVFLPEDSICVVENHVLHPFFTNQFDAGPVRLASIMHTFNYRIAMLRDVAKPALRIRRSQRAERRFLEDVSIPWEKQVAVMFQILIVLVFDVPEASTCLDKSQGILPNVLLSSEPWGHINHDGSACMCLSFDRTGACIHGLSINLADMETVDHLLSGDKTVRSGSIAYVSHWAGAYGRLLGRMNE